VPEIEKLSPEERAMNASTQPLNRSPLACPERSSDEPPPNAEASFSLSEMDTTDEQPGCTFLDILLRCLSAVNT